MWASCCDDSCLYCTKEGWGSYALLSLRASMCKSYIDMHAFACHPLKSSVVHSSKAPLGGSSKKHSHPFVSASGPFKCRSQSHIISSSSVYYPAACAIKSHLLARLKLVITLDGIGIRGRHLIPRLLRRRTRHTLLLPVLLRTGHSTILLTRELLRRAGPNGTITPLLLRRRSTLLVSVDVVVGHAPALGVLLLHLFICRLRVRRDDVPGVQKAREETQAAEGDID